MRKLCNSDGLKDVWLGYTKMYLLEVKVMLEVFLRFSTCSTFSLRITQCSYFLSYFLGLFWIHLYSPRVTMRGLHAVIELEADIFQYSKIFCVKSQPGDFY